MGREEGGGFRMGNTCIPVVVSFRYLAKPIKKKRQLPRTSLRVQWLRLHASNAEDVGLIPGRGIKIPHATWHSQMIF